MSRTSTRAGDVVIGEGRFVRLLSRGGWELAERTNNSGIVAVVALTSQDEIVLIEQHRPPVGAAVIELPAGLVGDVPGGEDESYEAAARRELVEETGYAAADLQRLIAMPMSPGLSAELLTFYLANDVTRVACGGGDASETIRVHVVPLAEADRWLRRRAAEGTMVATYVYAGLYFAFQARHEPPPSRS